MIINKLRTDSIWIGIILGILMPVITYIIFYLIGLGVDSASGKNEVLKPETIGLISIFSNLFLLRYYLLKLKYDLTGRGILLVTFATTITYFALYL